ncbi:TPA: hypothetical protein ACY4R5_002934 [Clostridium perfringens]|uniref:hypothetical protein n=1 Tax=Clostridium perfringens TaxID=1502 RepID=UPI00096AC0A5|nr:hypothetical protein [Clostridium perfringens]MDK0899294.1 hypothetical protein [Clostridium perfringens]MDM0903187.1 hypothetical protein [Clostridium perfringens]MDU2047909.1 hypothetical protein [Clostridium perfringens]
MKKITREEFTQARDQYVKFRREQEKYRRIEQEIAKKMLYRETDKLLEVADFLFDIKEIEKAEAIYNLVEEKVRDYEEKYDDIGINFEMTEKKV